MKKTLHNKKGFTLAELLIVVAIIAVLVAIAIPIFTAQLEKAREATDVLTDPKTNDDQNNITYTAGTDGDAGTYTAEVTAVQKKDEWQSSIEKIGGQSVAASKKGWIITGDVENGTVKITVKN